MTDHGMNEVRARFDRVAAEWDSNRLGQTDELNGPIIHGRVIPYSARKVTQITFAL